MAEQLKDPYAQIWESRNLKGLDTQQSTPLELDNKTPEWRRGVGAFADEMQATGYGLAALGAQGLQNIVGPNETLKDVTDWGLEGYQRNINESQSGLQAPSVARIEDIKTASDAMDWASFQLGKGLPMLGTLALSGGVGGLLGRTAAKEGVKAVAKAAIGDTIKKSAVAKGLQAVEGQVVTEAMKKAAAAAVRSSIEKGAIAGGFAGSFGLEGGLAFGEQVQAGATPADAVKSAIAVGGINGALEFLPFYKVAKDVGLGQHAKRAIAEIIATEPTLAKKAIGLAKELGGRMAKGGAEGAVTEGITEGLQELVSIAGTRWAKNDPLFADLTDADWSQIGNAAAAGALVGGVAAGAGATVMGSQAEGQDSSGGPSTQPPAVGPSAQPPTVPTAPPGIQTPSLEQTSTQVLEAMLERVNAELPAAQEQGNAERVTELERAKKIYEAELQVQQRSAEPAMPAGEQPTVEQPRTTESLATPIQESIAPVQESAAPIQEPSMPAEQIRPEAQPTKTQPSDSIQMKQGETVVLSPDGQTRAVPTAEQVANLNKLMGERPDKQASPQEAVPPVQETTPSGEIITQPEVIPNAEEVQAQTETPVVQEPKAPAWTPDLLREVASAAKLQIQDSATPKEPWVEFFAELGDALQSDPTFEQKTVDLLNEKATPIPESLPELAAKDTVQPTTEDFVKPIEVSPEDTTQAPQPKSPSQAYIDSTLEFALQDGKPLEDIVKIVKTFDLANPDSKWDIEYKPSFSKSGAIKLVSKKQGPAWEINWNDKLGTFDIFANNGKTKKINGQEIKIAGEVTQGNIGNVKSSLENVDPWTYAELKADIAQGMTDSEITGKWGSSIAFAADTYKALYGKDLTLIAALNDVSLWLPPSDQGLLASQIKNGVNPSSMLGGYKALQLVTDEGFAPNTVEAMVKQAPKGWKLEDAFTLFFDNSVNVVYTNNSSGGDIVVNPSKYALIYSNQGINLEFDSMEALLSAVTEYETTGKITPGNSSSQNAPAPVGSITSDANSDSSSSQDSETQGLPPAAPGFTLNLLSNNIASYYDKDGHSYYYDKVNKEWSMYNYSEGKIKEFKSFEDFVKEISSGDQKPTPNTVFNTSWAPTKLPNGYNTVNNNIFTTEDQIINTFQLTSNEVAEVAHIHNYLRHAQINLSEKIKLFKAIPTTSDQLAQFKANHPFLIRKVSIDEATNLDHAKTLLNDIVTRRDKYTFNEILQQAIKFQEKFGDEEFVAALAAAPKEQYQSPHLDGWLANMRAEEDLLSENPFETIWADYEVNKGGQGTYEATEAARYGVVVINPKTGKVLLRKVANQFEGITWDFARGGADRFSTPDAKPNLIDTNGLGTHDAPANKRYMEHPLIAAKREAKEEFGYEVKVIGQLAKGFYTANKGYEDKIASLYYVAVPVSEQTNEHLQPSTGTHIKETEDTRWVDIHEARNLLMTEPTLPTDITMKRDGKHKPRLARIARTLEAVFNPAMQHSDLDYRSSSKAMERYFKDGLTTDFPKLLPQAALSKSFNKLSELQKLNVAAALYVSKRFPNADTSTKSKLQKEVYKKRAAALKSWIQERIGSGKVSDILPGNASIGQIQAHLNQTGGKIVMSLWHGSKNTREAMIDDVINPVYFGWGWGGHDTKNGMYFSSTKDMAEKWGNKKQHNILVAFEKLKVIPETKSYDEYTFNQIIQQAKNEGYDGIFFENVQDTINGRQIVAWNSENMVAAGGEGIGFSGKNLYQSRGELGESLDVNTAKVLLNDTFGPVAQKMLDSGLLEFVESGGPDGVSGQWFGEEQKIRVYLDYISSPRELIGAVLHEGAHAGMREILGRSAEVYYKELLESNNPAAKSAMYKTAWEGARRYGIENVLTPENTAEIERVRVQLQKFDQDFLIEEDLANFVQQADPALPLWRKIFNAIKAWWSQSAVGKALKERGVGFELNPEMAAGLVTAALRTQSLRRGGDYSTYTAHASGADWTSTKQYPYGRPLLKYVLSSGGEGYINYGWGFYTSESVPTHTYYKSNVGNKTYGLHLPDDIPPRMIEWDRELWQQSSIVRDAITSSRDNYLMLRMAVKSKDRKSSYPGDTQLNLQEKGTGGAFYNQLRDYFHKLNYNGQFGFLDDPETGKPQKAKNLARRDASRKLAEYGIAGVRLLDAGSRKITVTRLPNDRYRLSKGTLNPHVQEFSEQEFIKHVGPDLAAKVKTYPVGEPKNHAGFGFYNSVFWRQTDLDRFTVVYKNGFQVAPKPKNNVSYDPNGIGIPYAEHPGFAEYIINPKTGEAHPQLSKAGKTAEVSLEDLRSNIDTVMGEGWLAQAEQAGLVEVVEGIGPNNESGSWDGGKIKLYTGSMPAGGSPAGVLLHEGKHATFKDVLGKSLNDYVSDLRTLANNGNQAARDAIIHATVAAAEILGIQHGFYDSKVNVDLDAVRAAIEEKRPGLLAEEELAYFVQYGTENQTGVGFLRRLINQIKAWFAQTKLGQRMKELGLGLELTEGMAVEWAKMGLHNSLAKIRVEEQATAQTLYQAAYMPASARLGQMLEGLNKNDPLYSIGLQELRQTLWTDPTDYRQDFVNRPGLLQKFRANFVDFFAEIEKKATNVYDAYSLMRNKKAATIEQSRQEYLLPLRELIANSPWTAEEVGDMLAARHIKLDDVNRNLAERASDGYISDLLKVLTPAKKKELERARKFVKDGKNPDGSDYTGAGFDPNGAPIEMASSTKRKLMFDLMNNYAPFEVKTQNGEQLVRMEWERFKDAAAGFSNGGVAKDMVRTVDEILALANTDQAKFNRIANLFDAMNRHTLDILEDGGLITASEHARLLADKSAYAPLRRESYNTDQEIEQLFLRAGQGGSKQLGTRTGTAELSEPIMVLQNALAKLEAAAAAAERNRANQELYHTVKANAAEWKPWFTIVDKDKYVTHDEDGFLKEKNSTALNKADITLILDGKKLVIRPNMHNQRAVGFVRAVNNLDSQVLNGPMRVLNWFNQIVRWVNVSASPVFLMMNAIRDPFTAAYNMQASEAAPYTKEIFTNYGKAFKALKKVFMDGNRDPTDLDVQAVERWENAGGRTSFVEALRAMDDTWRSFDAQVARRQGNLKQLLAVKDKWIDGIENFNILFENVMRFSTFQVLMDKGVVSDKRAARISQDLTTNFTRRGYKTQALGVWWLFFNATVQGNYQVLRNLMSSHRVQIATGGTIALALMLDLLGRAVAPDDWDKIPEWDKERFIILPIKIGGDFVKIPAPWVYNVVWRMGSSLGEILAGVKKPQDSLLDLASLTATTFNPVSGGTLAQRIAPTAADPFVQIMQNKDFAGNPLGPEGYPGAGKKANAELIWGNTPKGYQSFARYVNEATGGSAVESGVVDLRPADYQVLVKFLTGSLGRFMGDATFGVKEALTKGVDGPKDIPVVKELFSDPYDPVRTEKYHTNIAGIYGAHKLERMYRSGPDRDLVKLQEVRATRAKELSMYSQAQDVERQIKSLRTRIRAAQNRGDDTRVKVLRSRMEKVQEKFNAAYKLRVG